MVWIVDKILEALDARNKVNVLVHEAFFDNDPRPHYFIKISNQSAKNTITVTHVWIEDNKNKISVMTNKLPVTLLPSEIWETWILKDLIENQDDIFKNVRAMLSSNKVYNSKKNKKVPSQGYVANK